MRGIRDQSRRERIRNAGPKELEGCSREDGREKSERAYEEPWQLAKSLGPVPVKIIRDMNLRPVQGCRAKEVRWKRDGVGGGGYNADSGRVSELPDKARVVVGLNKLRNPSGEPA